jgi:hypothetical protein
MSISQKKQLIGSLVIIGLLMVLLAISLPDLQLQPGDDLYAYQDAEQESGTSETQEPDYTAWENFMRVFSAVVSILLVIYIVGSLFSKEGRKRLLGSVGLLILLALMMLVFSNVWSSGEPIEEVPVSEVDEGELEETEEFLGTAVEFDPEPKSWLLTLVIVSGAVLLAVIVFFLVNSFSDQGSQEILQFDELAEKAQSALEDIEADHINFEDIIIRCYADMSHVLQTQTGIQRDQAMTTFEFEQELIKRGFPTQPVQQLTRLFEQVRYGHQETGEPEKQSAVESLGEIVEYCKVYA